MTLRRYALLGILLLAVAGCSQAPTQDPVSEPSSTPFATVAADTAAPPEETSSAPVTNTTRPPVTLEVAATPGPLPSLTAPATGLPQPSSALGVASATGSPVATSTVTPQPTPSATESPEMQLETGRALQATGNCPAARQEFAALLAEPGAASPGTPSAAGGATPQRAEAAYRLAQCYLADGAPAEAAEVLAGLLATAGQDDVYRAPANFILGDAHSALADWAAAEDDYRRFLALAPDLSSLTWQRIAATRAAREDLTGAAAAYTSALDGAPGWSNTVTIRRALADLALQKNDGLGAAAQYDILRGTLTKGAFAAEMQYLAGSALDKAGDRAAALTRWQAATVADPTSQYAHAAMAGLVDAGASVDEFLRGQIDYSQGLYQLAVEAFERYTSQNPAGQGGQVGLAWYYRGRSYIGLGDTARGLADLGNFIAAYPDNPLAADAWLARARAQQRAGDTTGAITTYRQFAAARPADPQAPKALYQAANLEGGDNALETTAQAYLALARRYPAADEGWRSYLAAGLTYFRLNKWQQAADIWQEMAGANLSATGRAVAYYWLGRAQAAAGEPQAARASWSSAWQSAPTSFYGLRAADWAAQSGQPLPAANTGRLIKGDRDPVDSGVGHLAARLGGRGLPDPAAGRPEGRRLAAWEVIAAIGAAGFRPGGLGKPATAP